MAWANKEQYDIFLNMDDETWNSVQNLSPEEAYERLSDEQKKPFDQAVTRLLRSEQSCRYRKEESLKKEQEMETDRLIGLRYKFQVSKVIILHVVLCSYRYSHTYHKENECEFFKRVDHDDIVKAIKVNAQFFETVEPCCDLYCGKEYLPHIQSAYDEMIKDRDTKIIQKYLKRVAAGIEPFPNELDKFRHTESTNH
jgi:hypothetical protein